MENHSTFKPVTTMLLKSNKQRQNDLVHRAHVDNEGSLRRLLNDTLDIPLSDPGGLERFNELQDSNQRLQFRSPDPCLLATIFLEHSHRQYQSLLLMILPLSIIE